MNESSIGRPIGTVYGALLNDADAVRRLSPSFGDAPYRAAPVAPILYLKPRNTWVADGATVPIPAEPGVVRIDATIGAVIGRVASRVDAADARSYVKGFVVVSDVTLPHESVYRPAIRERCRDGFCPIGAMTAADGFDMDAAEVVVRVNGDVVHRRSLANLVRPLDRLLADVTDFMTLAADDILLVGPPDAAPLARPGDQVSIEVTGLATLNHGVALEQGA